MLWILYNNENYPIVVLSLDTVHYLDRKDVHILEAGSVLIFRLKYWVPSLCGILDKTSLYQ